jgi:hypothetical protein
MDTSAYERVFITVVFDNRVWGCVVTVQGFLLFIFCLFLKSYLNPHTVKLPKYP